MWIGRMSEIPNEESWEMKINSPLFQILNYCAQKWNCYSRLLSRQFLVWPKIYTIFVLDFAHWSTVYPYVIWNGFLFCRKIESKIEWTREKTVVCLERKVCFSPVFFFSSFNSVYVMEIVCGFRLNSWSEFLNLRNFHDIFTFYFCFCAKLQEKKFEIIRIEFFFIQFRIGYFSLARVFVVNLLQFIYLFFFRSFDCWRDCVEKRNNKKKHAYWVRRDSKDTTVHFTDTHKTDGCSVRFGFLFFFWKWDGKKTQPKRWICRSVCMNCTSACSIQQPTVRMRAIFCLGFKTCGNFDQNMNEWCVRVYGCESRAFYTIRRGKGEAVGTHSNTHTHASDLVLYGERRLAQNGVAEFNWWIQMVNRRVQ